MTQSIESFSKFTASFFKKHMTLNLPSPKHKRESRISHLANQLLDAAGATGNQYRYGIVFGRIMGWKQTLFSGVLVVACTVVVGATAAAQSSSSNYKVNEYFFGSGGELEACSDSYCSKQSAGEVTVGSTASDNYMAQAGFNTSDVPLLEVAVNGSVDFGVLDANSTATGFATVQVRTYLASGYVMRLVGPPPSYTSGGNTSELDAPSSPVAVDPGTEQFGINLRANTDPLVGADVVQVPDNTFSFGIPTTNYNTPDAFMYQSNDIIAQSDSSSGQTNYTISMIANMSATTPAGKYLTDLSVVVTSSF